MPGVGWSDTFREALRLAGWFGDPPFNAYTDHLFRADAVGARVRERAAAHPFVTMLGWRDVCRFAELGPLADGDALQGLSRARLARLSAPGWTGWLLHLSEAFADKGDPGAEAADLLRFLAAVPVDWIPEGVEDANELVTAFRLARAASEATGRSPHDLLASCKGEWGRLCVRCLSSPAQLPLLGPRGLTGYLADPVKDLAASVVLPAMLRTGGDPTAPEVPRAIARDMLYGGKGLTACIELALDWHRNIHRIEGAKPDGNDPDLPWDRPIPDWTCVVAADGAAESGRYRVVYLNTRRALREEGAPGPGQDGVPGLDHCVASYHAGARSAESHIVSIRRDLPGGGYERMATVEVRPRRDGLVGLILPHADVRQVAGRGNGRPPDGTLGVLTHWLGRRGDRHARRIAWERLKLRWKGGQPLRNLGAELCGYDWRDGAQAAEALAAYAFLLPRDLREWGAFEAHVAKANAGRPEGTSGAPVGPAGAAAA